MTHAIFPRTFPLLKMKLVVCDTFDDMLCRVVGGMMSMRAARRSTKVSSVGISEETEERETEEDVLDDDDEAYGEF